MEFKGFKGNLLVFLLRTYKNPPISRWVFHITFGTASEKCVYPVYIEIRTILRPQARR